MNNYIGFTDIIITESWFLKNIKYYGFSFIIIDPDIITYISQWPWERSISVMEWIDQKCPPLVHFKEAPKTEIL